VLAEEKYAISKNNSRMLILIMHTTLHIKYIDARNQTEVSEVTLGQLPVPEGADRKDGEGLFTRGWSDRTRGNSCKLKEGRFRLDIGKKFFPIRVVKPWSRLPRQAVDAPSLAVLNARLDGALNNLVWWKMSLLMAGGLEPHDL